MEKVHSPLGGETFEPTTMAPRLERLDGKTIGETWNGDFKGDYTFPIIRKLLQETFTRLKVVPYNEFPYLYGADNPERQKELARDIAARARELGCHALISGNGA